MTDKKKEIIKFINDQFKNHKIIIDVEQKRIDYYNSKNDWLGTFYLETNDFYIIYWFYNNLMEHFKNRYQMYEFIKPFLGKIIGRSLNRVI